jgi:signal peptidase I
MISRATNVWKDWRAFALFVLIMLVFRSAIADWNQVPSGSMKPGILIGDRIVVDKLAYDLRVPFTRARIITWGAPVRGDVVTFPSPEDERLFVKRVVAVPGDIIEMRNNHLIINGEAARYTRISAEQRAAIPLANKYRYHFYREEILGHQRMIMVRADDRLAHHASFTPITVPAGQQLMLGEKREDSRDSRWLGLIGRDRIVGRAHTVAFSLDYENYYAPRMERFLAPL